MRNLQSLHPRLVDSEAAQSHCTASLVISPLSPALREGYTSLLGERSFPLPSVSTAKFLSSLSSQVGCALRERPRTSLLGERSFSRMAARRSGMSPLRRSFRCGACRSSSSIAGRPSDASSDLRRFNAGATGGVTAAAASAGQSAPRSRDGGPGRPRVQGIRAYARVRMPCRHPAPGASRQLLPPPADLRRAAVTSALECPLGSRCQSVCQSTHPMQTFLLPGAKMI